MDQPRLDSRGNSTDCDEVGKVSTDSTPADGGGHKSRGQRGTPSPDCLQLRGLKGERRLGWGLQDPQSSERPAPHSEGHLTVSSASQVQGTVALGGSSGAKVPRAGGRPARGVRPASHEVPKGPGQKGEVSQSRNQAASAARCPLHTPASPPTARPPVTRPESTCNRNRASADSPLASGPGCTHATDGAQQGHRVPSGQPRAFLQGPPSPRLHVSQSRSFTNSCYRVKGEA